MSPTELPESNSQESPSAPTLHHGSGDAPHDVQGGSSPGGGAPPTESRGTEDARAPGEASEASAGSEAGEAREGGAAEASEAGEGSEPREGAVEGVEKKKRRRRRRKKKTGEGATAEAGAAAEGSTEPGAEGETESGEGAPRRADGESAAEGGAAKKKRKKKKKFESSSRERPAFNVSDVVFGKIVEVNDDVIIVDLSGKAHAIFDKLELVLPEDSIDVEDEARRAEELAESIVAGTIDPDVGLQASAIAQAESASSPNAPEPADAAAAAGSTNGEASAPRGKIIRIVRPSAPESEPASEAPAGVVAGGAPAERAADEAREPAPENAPDAAAAPAPAAEPIASATAEPSASGEAVAALPEASSEEAAAASAAEVGASEPSEPEEHKSSVLQLPRVVLEPGAPFVGVVRNDGSRGGLVVLTHHPHRGSKSKPAVAAAFKKRSEIFGLVTGVIKGGVEVDVEGVRAFAPGSQMELRLGADLHHLIGRRLPFLVTHYAKRGRDVIVSRRSMLEEEAKAAREAALAKLKVGETLDGIVRSVVQFGAFVDLGGVEGLVPLMEMSHNRGDRPSDVFKVGETVPVLVQKIDERGKIWLSRKATLPDPWGEAAKKYALRTKHTGKVVRIQPFGAFVELERGIDGLIHTADLSFKRIEKPEDVVKVGDTLEVVVASLDSSNHKIGLHPALTGAMAEEAPQKVEVGGIVKAAVLAIETGGLMMRILGATGRSARAFMPASTTGTPRGTELRKIFPPGHVLEAKIIEKDPRRGEVKLSIKALQQDTERNAYQQYRQQVKREAKFGTFADLLSKKNPQK
jgi:small subunit ribosomal protein S1